MQELSFKERVIETMIVVWATASKYWANVLRPGTAVAAGIIVLSGVLSLLKAQDVPDAETWQRGAAANTALTVSAAAAMILTFLMALGYRRLLQKNTDARTFYSACRSVWGLIDEASPIGHRNLAVHVWLVTGFPGARYLTRAATFKPQRRRPSPVKWRRGKGVIGKCWETGAELLEDLEPLELSEEGGERRPRLTRLPGRRDMLSPAAPMPTQRRDGR